MLGEQSGIAVALGKARNPDDDLGEAIIEIVAERARRDHCVEVLMGRTHDPGVDCDRLASADPLDHPLLQESQQLDLKRQRNVADLVEEQCPAMGELDLALGRLDRAGEGALFVAEQFGLEQVFGDRRAIDRDEAAAAAPARLVQAAGEQFLAGPARAEQHDRNVGIGDALDRAGDLQHLGRRRHHRAQNGSILADPAFEPPVLALDAVELERAADDQAELIDIDRLLVEIISARCDRPQRAFPRAVAGGDDHLRFGLQRQDRLERGEALAHAVGIRRQAKIERHDRRLGRAHDVERAGAVGGDEDLIIVIGPAQLALETLVVLHDQQLWLDGHVHARIRS